MVALVLKEDSIISVVVKRTFLEFKDNVDNAKVGLRTRSRSEPCVYRDSFESDLAADCMHVDSEVRNDAELEPLLGYYNDLDVPTQGNNVSVGVQTDSMEVASYKMCLSEDVSQDAEAIPTDTDSDVAALEESSEASTEKPHSLSGKDLQLDLAFVHGDSTTSNRSSSSSNPSCGEGLTTVMLQHLPGSYSRNMLLKMIDDAGFAGSYDFVYLPIDFHLHTSYGYAFVNFQDPEMASRFWTTFNNFSNWAVPSRKRCRSFWSKPIQGLGMNIARYRNSPVMHTSVPDEFKPVVFAGGVRVTFPPPTKSVRFPRFRGQYRSDDKKNSHTCFLRQ